MVNNEIPKDILPTLIVGLGGTGFQVIKRLKKLFERRYGNQNLPIRYLIIDTDLKSFLDDTLVNNEKCQLRFNEGIKSTLDWAYSNPNFDWLPQNPPITPDFFTSTDQGAGLMRPIGRLYLCKNSKLVYDTLNTAKNDLVDLYKILTEVGAVHLENIDRHKVYIVGSLAGGTGCGTFLDVAVMLSKIFNRDNTNLIGMFTLESCYDDKLSSDLDAQNRSKANCYAALKELEFYMSSIKNPDDERYRFKYSNLSDIKLEKKLLDICYLIENKNEAGGVLTNIEDIYDLCALQLYHEVGTKLGSQLRADYANFICKDKDPVLKRDRHFSTFSSSSMEIPVENLKNYSSYRLASDILDNISKNKIEEKLEDNVYELIDNIENEIYKSTYLDEGEFEQIEKQDISLSSMKSKIYGADEKVKNVKLMWENNFEDNKEKIERLLEEYTNKNTIIYGVDGIESVLRNVNMILKEKANGIIVSNKHTAESLCTSITDKHNEIDKTKSSKRRKAKLQEESKKNINDINVFLESKKKERDKFIETEFSNIIDNIINKIIEDIKVLNKNIHQYKNKVSMSLQKINGQVDKIYGGNIISREMVSKEFYEKSYMDYYGDHLDATIIEMMTKDNLDDVFKMEKDKPEDISILSLMKYDVKYLISLCQRKVEMDNKLDKLAIIDILRKNAETKKIDSKTYIKDEIEISAKLAKPFWSAIKNPEVSWTECYYIGAVKDDNITNGFTIRPHEEIDSWIRSQTGEKSRQARYVETTNPNSIDVIHITMGACAGYLPNIKHYKQFYLKLLSNQTYPLHLNEKYVGLDDLVIDMDELFKLYTLSQAYGAIVKVHGRYIDNLNEDNGQFIYKSPYNLEIDETSNAEKELPKNISEIDEKLVLGIGQREVIERMMDDRKLERKLKAFVENIESRYSEEELKNHKIKYVQSYKEIIKDKKNVNMEKDIQDIDFIAYEKLRYQNSFN